MENTTNTRRKMDEHLASGSTETLATVLLLLDAKEDPSPAERRAAAEVTEELIRRHRDVVIPALEAWEADLNSTMSIAQAVVAALPI